MARPVGKEKRLLLLHELEGMRLEARLREGLVGGAQAVRVAAAVVELDSEDDFRFASRLASAAIVLPEAECECWRFNAAIVLPELESCLRARWPPLAWGLGGNRGGGRKCDAMSSYCRYTGCVDRVLFVGGVERPGVD